MVPGRTRTHSEETDIALTVAVVGGGIGGLCLAQGLRRARLDVTVYERDQTLDERRQGYRLHVDARAGLALQQCLPPQLFELFLATCGSPSHQFTVVTEKLKVLHEEAYPAAADPFAPATLSTSVDRRTLREILASGLEDRIVTAKELTRYEADERGVRLFFADGGTAKADVLVGADGTNSTVRQQYLPHATVADTGTRIIYGKTPISDEARDLLPAPLQKGFTAVVGGAVGMATGLLRFRRRPEEAAAELFPLGKVRLSPADDYLMWAVSAHQKQFGATDETLAALTPAHLHALAAKMIRSWDPGLRRLQMLADIEETFLVRVRCSVPVPAWPPSRVTLLGDAIHAMSPARGSGANTALKDASELCRALALEPADVVQAIGEYEQRMRDYGYAAVEASRRAETETGSRRNRALFWLYRKVAR